MISEKLAKKITNKMKKSFVALGCGALFFAISENGNSIANSSIDIAKSQNSLETISNKQTPKFIDDIIQQEPTIEEKIGQMLMVGFSGTSVSPDHHIIDDIKNKKLGGVILFARNTGRKNTDIEATKKRLQELTSFLENASETDLLIGIDQEGGNVSRLNEKFNISHYTAENLGKIDDPKLTYEEALKTASELKKYNIDVNFAPCADVGTNNDSLAIGKWGRSFSNDPVKVAIHSAEVVKAHKENGILSVLKHFPGHGSAKGDTHDGYVDTTNTYSEQELIPFIEIMKQTEEIGIMVTHITNRNIDEKMPLSLSEKNITGLLKGELDFDGIVFSDDLQMKALTNNYNWEEILINSINAGTDILVIGNHYPDTMKTMVNDSITIIANAVKDGRIPVAEIDDSYDKIMHHKAQKNNINLQDLTMVNQSIENGRQ